MLNRDFLRRYMFRLARGNGGWLPQYLFYLGSSLTETGSQIAFCDQDPKIGDGLMRPAAFNATFAKHGGNPLPYMGDLVADFADHLRFTRNIYAQPIDPNGGIKKSISLQNYYIGLTYGTADAESLQLSPRIALAAAQLDPDLLIDPTPGSFNSSAEVDYYLDPSMRSASSSLDSKFVDLMKTRLTHGMREGQNTSHVMSADPYLDSSIQGSNGMLVPALVSSNLDYDSTLPMLRFVGFVYGPIFPEYMTTDIDPDLLKLTLGAGPMTATMLNANCVLLAARTSNRWYSPVGGLIQGGVSPIASVSPVYESTLTCPSGNFVNFVSSTAPVVANAAARSPYSYRSVITISNGGTNAQGTYKVERYLDYVIEHSLVSHLPFKDAYGNDSEYFTSKATFKHDYLSGYYDLRTCDLNTQPVAFPSAQLPEDPWLWFVSMDDNYAMWLNKQKLGTANSAICVSALPSSPLQMVVTTDYVWLLYGSSIDVLQISTGTWRRYRASVELPDVLLTSIAVDREVSRVWVGHETGIFEFTNFSVQSYDLSAIPAKARRVSKQGLVAVNNYLSWNTNDDIRWHGSNEALVETYVSYVDLANNNVFAWSPEDVIASSQYVNLSSGFWRIISRTALRSNGEIMIVHSAGESPMMSSRVSNIGLSWFKVKLDGTLFRRCYIRKFGVMFTDDATFFHVIPIHRIDDFHYVSGIVPYAIPGTWNAAINGLEKDEFVFGNIGFYGVQGAMMSVYSNGNPQPQAIEFRIDGERNRIYTHPNMYDIQSDNNSRIDVSQYSDKVNFPAWKESLLPGGSLVTRGSDMEFALHSSSVVILNKAYALLMCGRQCNMPLGVELGWDGSNWVHGTAQHPTKPKAMHANQQAISDHVSVAFDPSNTGFQFNGKKVYRIDAFPGTSASIPSAALYMGDYIVKTETATIGSDGATTVSAASSEAFCGIDTAQTKDLAASIGGTPLTLVSSSPTANQFAVEKTGRFIFNASRAGLPVQLTYNFIQQAV